MVGGRNSLSRTLPLTSGPGEAALTCPVRARPRPSLQSHAARARTSFIRGVVDRGAPAARSAPRRVRNRRYYPTCARFINNARERRAGRNGACVPAAVPAEF